MTMLVLSNEMNATVLEAVGIPTVVVAAGLVDGFNVTINGECEIIPGDGVSLDDFRSIGDLDLCLVAQLVHGYFSVTGTRLRDAG